MSHRRPARLVLVVDHDGAVQMSTCPDCTESPDQVDQVLKHVMAVFRRHPDGGFLGDLGGETYDE